VRFSDLLATRAWIFQSLAKVLRAFKGIYILLPPGAGPLYFVIYGMDARELVEVVGPEDDLLLAWSTSPTVFTSSAAWLDWLIATICVKSTLLAFRVFISWGLPRTCVKLLTSTSTGIVRLISHCGSFPLVFPTSIFFRLETRITSKRFGF
jgi:hypothetical protein